MKQVGGGWYILLKTQDGVNVLWDGQKDVIIHVPTKYQASDDHQLIGLCGLYDGNSTNDFTKFDEFSDLSKEMLYAVNPSQEEINAFAQSFKTGGISCKDNNLDVTPYCYSDSGNMNDGYLIAEKVCSTLEDAVFQPCHHLVDPQPFIMMCKRAMCNTNYMKHHDSFCDVFSLYAHTCAWYHDTSLPWRYKFKDLCRKLTACV